MSEQIAVRNALLIDGTDATPAGNIDVIVRDGRIVEIGQGITAAIDEANIIDEPNLTVMPALIDCHVHLTISADPRSSLTDDRGAALTALMAANHLRATLRAGVTTVRDLGGPDNVNILLARAVEEGLTEGPRIFAAGRWICMTGGHGWQIGYEVDGPDEMRKAVREQMKAGAHLIKFMATGGVLSHTDPRRAQLSIGEMRAGVEEAHKAGRRVAAHAHSAEGVKNSLAAGVDTIEHGTLMDEEALQMLIERDAFYVPTLAPIANILAGGTESGLPEWILEKAASVIEAHKRNFQAALRGGAKIATGTDAGDPLTFHGDNARELRFMVDWGMSPMQAIVAGTRTGADLLEILDEVGTVEVGKRADLLVVRGNPLDDIRLLEQSENIVAVIKDGKIVHDAR